MTIEHLGARAGSVVTTLSTVLVFAGIVQFVAGLFSFRKGNLELVGILYGASALVVNARCLKPLTPLLSLVATSRRTEPS